MWTEHLWKKSMKRSASAWNFLHNGNGREMSALQLYRTKKRVIKMEQRVYEIKRRIEQMSGHSKFDKY